VLKKIIAPVVIGGALLGGAATTGPAYAATAPASTVAHASKGQIKAWVRAHRKELRKAGLDLSAKTIGITPATLRADLKSGNSVAGVASQHNVNPQTVINAVVTAADSKINQAVTDHQLTSTQASTIEAKLPGLVMKAVDHTF
jgi:hypothetical protein